VSKSKRQSEYAAAYAGLIGQIGCITSVASAIIIAIAFFAGQFIDNYFGTRGIFTVLALLGSFPITLYVIVRIAMSNVARAQNLLDSNEDDELEAETDR
jgi:F0F1-type ATP synthase assembly protein I